MNNDLIQNPVQKRTATSPRNSRLVSASTPLLRWSVAKPVAKENVPDEKGVVFPTFKNGARAWAATAEATIEYMFND